MQMFKLNKNIYGAKRLLLPIILIMNYIFVQNVNFYSQHKI